MADNFRNKQWFKKMPQEEKDKICKQFDINEKTLRKAGRETDDGRIVINLLKIDHLLHMPKKWGDYNKVISANKLEHCTGTIEELIEQLQNIYKLFNDVSFLKYKNIPKNNVLVEQQVKYVNNWIDKYYSDNYDKEYCAYQIYTHINCLFDSDLKLIKNKD